ncbi:MAG TPA: protein ndvB, partial [Ilumatobacteraceae bacterium]|nr:protein ndvB [Ilumatobacteraceae bacterium]
MRRSTTGHPTRGSLRARASGELDEPIVAELFSIERLEQHARTLAAAQRVRPGFERGEPIRPRVTDNGRILLEAYRVLADALKEAREITPAAEWLVDNFAIVDEQIREIHDDLPADFYRELPKLDRGHLEGYPRVLGLAWAYVAHTDSRFDPEGLRRMVVAYQGVETLTIGELWALAISLRIVLIENLRRLAERIVSAREARQAADELADSLLGLGDERLRSGSATVDRRTLERLSTAGRVQLFQRLRDQDPAATPALGILEEMLAAHGTTAEEMVHTQHQLMAMTNVTVRNVITSMRLISWFDWAAFVEQVGVVDAVLRGGSAFAEMDFTTRNQYRNAVERMARGSTTTEVEVAQRAVEMAAAHRHDPTHVEMSDPGYFLIGGGRADLEEAVHLREGVRKRIGRALLFVSAPLYFTGLVIVTALILLPALVMSGDSGVGAVTITILALGPASDLAVALVNRVVTRCVGPHPLPRIDFDDGVPTDRRTLVAVPMLLTTVADIEQQVSVLEVHFLGNGAGDVWFALLSDWLDAPTEHTDDDEKLLSAAAAGIDRLNARYGPDHEGGARFLLLHRSRRWNEREKCWMGWERKRGKLEELNALLRGSTSTSYLRTPARASSIPPAGVRYVVTLDADTRLPRSAVGQLVGTMAHPLNEPRFDPRLGRVTHGYGILQPRITPSLPTPEDASIYQRSFAGPAGVDPYASAVSDVYQDLFQEGSFTGKGIYDVDAFAASLNHRVAENTLLSHDLFEGVFARAGLVTNVELFDEFPSNYLVDSARRHRWVRGDWQLLPWILGFHGRDEGTADRAQRRVGAVGRWKMFDNLRRSLVAPLAVATMIAAWTIGSVAAGWWVSVVVVSMVVPAVLPVLSGLKPRRRGISKRSHLRDIGGDLTIATARIFLGLAFLADQAWLMLDAVLRTLWRLVSRRHMLEWQTAAQSKSKSDVHLDGYCRQMVGGVAVATLAAVMVAVLRPTSSPLAVPFLLLWVVAPVIAYVVSRTPVTAVPEELTSEQITVARSFGRRTWQFFDHFVGEQDHWLPPDNFQDDPVPALATRTSPTNIGMYLLATVTARDFGWIGTVEMVERLDRTLVTIGQLELWKGHLYNWYDTRTLKRL